MTDLAFKEELRAEMRLNRAAAQDLRQVTRTLVVSVDEMRGDMHEMRDDMRGMRTDVREMRDSVTENTDTIKALTEAIFHVLDELRGRGPSAGTA